MMACLLSLWQTGRRVAQSKALMKGKSTLDRASEGRADGTADGLIEGVPAGGEGNDGCPEATLEGASEGSADGSAEGLALLGTSLALAVSEVEPAGALLGASLGALLGWDPPFK